MGNLSSSSNNNNNVNFNDSNSNRMNMSDSESDSSTTSHESESSELFRNQGNGKSYLEVCNFKRSLIFSCNKINFTFFFSGDVLNEHYLVLILRQLIDSGEIHMLGGAEDSKLPNIKKKPNLDKLKVG